MFRMHNDAVVQGLGELPFMRGVERWGIFTVGTGARQRPLQRP